MASETYPADRIADMLETLVNIPSVTGQEGAIADWLMNRLRGRPGGELLRSGHSVVWRPVPGHPRRPLLVLAGHIDTVPPQGNDRARREDGKLFGLGTTDMKGGDAVMLALLDVLHPNELRFDVAAVFYDAEEGPHANNGLKRLLNEMPWLREATLAILLEPTDLKVELGCNGVINAEVTVRGKSAHSARPWTGVNAVQRAASWLAEITRFEPRPVQFAGAEFVETLQVTLLKAGRARNIVPDELVANLNYRFTPDRTLAEAERTLRAMVPPEFEVAVVDAAEPGRVCGDDPEVQSFVRRFAAKVAGKQGWTDVAQFTAAGVPAFNFGPGIPELCHQPGEFCPIANLETACRWLQEFVTRERA
jgi:succinyl-diaminopimelate desuccinylase